MTWDILHNDDAGVLRVALEADGIRLQRLTVSAQALYFGLSVPELRALVAAVSRHWAYGLADILAQQAEDHPQHDGPVSPLEGATAATDAPSTEGFQVTSHRAESVLEHCIRVSESTAGKPLNESACLRIRKQLEQWWIPPEAAYFKYAKELAEVSRGAYPVQDDAHDVPSPRAENVLEHCLRVVKDASGGLRPGELTTQHITEQLHTWGIPPTGAYRDHAQALARASQGQYPVEENV